MDSQKKKRRWGLEDFDIQSWDETSREREREKVYW